MELLDQGRAAPTTARDEAIAALERVLRPTRSIPGALHYWIHLWEPTKTPERAEQEADRLLPLMPGAGHIVHMPAHIYLRRRPLRRRRQGQPAGGRRRRGLHRAVPRAGDVSARLLPAQHPLRLDGRDDVGAERAGDRVGAQSSRRRCPLEALTSARHSQGFLVVPYYALVRFGKWDEILAEPKPAHDTIFTRGRVALRPRHGAGGEGPVWTRRPAELAALEAIVADPALPNAAGVVVAQYARMRFFGSRRRCWRRRSRCGRKDFDRALLHLDRAVRFEDALDLHRAGRLATSRSASGSAARCSSAGRPVEAESVYWDDLRRNPENGWSLSGLAQALEAQGKKDDAARIRERFVKRGRRLMSSSLRSSARHRRAKGS